MTEEPGKKKDYSYTTASGQKRMQRTADHRIMDAYKVFNDIQTGPNSLSPDEIRRLIDERGGIWCLFEEWASPEEGGS